jgi:hypothetical protein
VARLIGGELLGRRRRAELAIVAGRQFQQPAAAEYLHAEASRFARQLGAAVSSYDTMSYAMCQLIELAPASGGSLLSGALDGTRFSGANWDVAIRMINQAARLRIAEAAPGILSAVTAGLGRHDDGTRAEVVCGYAACAGPAAVAVLEPMLDTIDDVRADCERCALLAGLVTAAPGEARYDAQARGVLEKMLAGRLESTESGAAISLLKALDAVGAPGFGDLAVPVLERGKKDQYADKALAAWLAEAVPRMS